MDNSSDQTPPAASAADMLFKMNFDETQRLIPTAVFLGVIAVVGIIGNGLVIHVYRTRYKLSNAKIFIVSVSVIDMCSCCVALPFEIMLLMEQYTFEHTWLCKLSRFCNTLGTCSSSFILLFIAIDRFRKVCKPLKKQISPKLAKFFCVLSAILGLIVAWPAIFVYGRKTFEINLETDDPTLIGSECSTADSMSESKIPFYYTFMFGVMFIIGIVTMVILYCLIGCRIRKQAKKMALTTARSMSIPMTSSICVEHDCGKMSGEIVPNNISKSDLIQMKNKSIKQQKSAKIKYGKNTDESWADKKDIELSYTSYSGDDVKPNGDVTTNDSKKRPTVKVKDADDKTMCENGHANGDVSTENRAIKINNDAEICDNDISDELQPDLTISLKKRVSSIGSTISHVFRRMTSFGVENSDNSNVDTLRKSQYLKEARARKTAFIMFLISLAYILSYLPHLILMATRVVKTDFVDELTDDGRATYKFFLRSYFLNCAINPLIYGVCDTRFRSSCADAFDSCCSRKRTS